MPTAEEERNEDIAWTFLEALADAAKVGEAVKVVHFCRSLCKEVDGLNEDVTAGIAPNPFFLANGHTSGASYYTRSYLGNRRFKSIGGAGVSLAGTLASSATVVDVGALAQHSNALLSTSAHMMQVKAVASGFSRSKKINEWVDAILQAKSAKAAIRGTGLAAGAIPVPAIGVLAGVVAAAAKCNVKLTLSALIQRVAIEIHWRAFQEVKVASAFGGVSGPQGPASAIFYEIFTRRGVTRIFGKYNVAKLINEQGGWAALNDKLMLM
ncbi:MAG: hypothetical protein H6998_00195 [Hahellaceae bacterium]|jgi:hypothetical protein|nr:hypothetical protein [Hahellaceae bacterium]